MDKEDFEMIVEEGLGLRSKRIINWGIIYYWRKNVYVNIIPMNINNK